MRKTDIKVLEFQLGHEPTKEDCMDVVRTYNNFTKFETRARSVYVYMKRNGWLEDAAKFYGYSPIHSKEECRKAASKYKTKAAFQRECNCLYQTAMRMGWIDDICSHMKTAVRSSHTKEECIEMAKGYRYISDFIRDHSSVYGYCQRNRWLNDVFGHMERKPYHRSVLNPFRRIVKCWENICCELADAVNKQLFDGSREYCWVDDEIGGTCDFGATDFLNISDMVLILQNDITYDQYAEWHNANLDNNRQISLRSWLMNHQQLKHNQ